MRRKLFVLALCMVFSNFAHAVPKTQTVGLGRWPSVKWMSGTDEDQAIDLRIRPLTVDEKLKEYTSGPAHDVTEHLFVVRRVFRLNDLLPDDKSTTPRSLWELGRWLLVDRRTGRVTPVNLPDFDSSISVVA